LAAGGILAIVAVTLSASNANGQLLFTANWRDEESVVVLKAVTGRGLQVADVGKVVLVNG
jgi:hypothetical protein